MQQQRLEAKDISPQTADDMEQVQDIINQKQVREQSHQQSFLYTTLSIRHTDTESDNKTENNKKSSRPRRASA